MAQVYTGMDSDYTQICPMRTESEVSETLEDFIHQNGAMRGLLSDNAKSEMSQAVKGIQ